MARRKDTPIGLQIPTAVALLLLGIGSSLAGALYVGPQLERFAASLEAPYFAPKPDGSAAPPSEDRTARETAPARRRSAPAAGSASAAITADATEKREKPRAIEESDEDPDTLALERLPVEPHPEPIPAPAMPPPGAIPTTPELPSGAASDRERLATANPEPGRRDARSETTQERRAGAPVSLPPAPPATTPIYKVQLGRFRSREEAEQFRQQLQLEHQVPGLLVELGGEYRVQTGAYRSRESALRHAETLRGVKQSVDVIEF